MGFFSEVLSGMMEAGAKNLETRYRNMSDSELKSEWNRAFNGLPYERSAMYQSNSPNALLDKEYAYRFNCKTWKETCEERLNEQAKEEREREKKESENSKFNNSLSSNPMVKDIIDKINELAYDVFNISVLESNIECFDDLDNSLWTLRFKKYGYPDLDDDKRRILAKYLCEHLSLSYKLDGTQLELDDAPGGMKSSW